MRKTHRHFGFTIIELLVVVAIIGLLASIISAAVTNARVKARDARRLTDVKQVKTGMDLYFANCSEYPPAVDFVANNQISCGSTPVLRVPADPLTPQYDYIYTPVLINGRLSEYTVQFVLERTGATYTMDEDGQFLPALPN